MKEIAILTLLAKAILILFSPFNNLWKWISGYIDRFLFAPEPKEITPSEVYDSVIFSKSDEYFWELFEKDNDLYCIRRHYY